MRKYYQKRVDAGLCKNCGKCPPRPGYLTCETCAEKERNAQRKTRQLRREAGRCVACGVELPKNWKGKYCKLCSIKRAKWQRLYHSGLVGAYAKVKDSGVEAVPQGGAEGA